MRRPCRLQLLIDRDGEEERGALVVGSYKFSWEEKLVAPLIATPNVDKANRRQKEIGKKATLQATRVIQLAERNTILFCKQIGQCPSTNYASSLNGFKMD